MLKYHKKIYKKLKSYYRMQMFFPGIFGAFVNPFFIVRLGLAKRMRATAKRLDGSILDVGCGSMPYKELFKTKKYIGLDIDSERARKVAVADYFYDGSHFPFPNDSFDNVICNEVLEHVFEPNLFFEEIYRIIKPGGMIFLTVPFVWNEHEAPYDYARYTSFGIHYLFEKHKFEIIEQDKLGGTFDVISELIIASMQKKGRILRMISCIIFPLFNVTSILLNCASSCTKSRDLFLTSTILAKKLA